MPSLVARLVRRGDLYYFRMAVPRRLVSQLQRSEVKLSLKTGCRSDAILRCRLLSNALDLAFRRLATMTSGSSFRDVESAGKAMFQQLLNEALERSYLLPSDDAYQPAAEIAYLRRVESQTRDECALQSFGGIVRRGAEEILQVVRSSGTLTDLETVQHAHNVAARATIENARILAARLEGRPDQTAPNDPLFAGMRAEMPPLPGFEPVAVALSVTLMQAGDRFLQFKSAHDWNAKTVGDVKRVLDLVYDVLDGQRPILTVNVDDVKNVRDLILKLPPNYMKSKDAANIRPVQAAKNNASGTYLSLKTQDKYFSMFRGFLKWSVDEELLAKMPAPNVKIPGVAKIGQTKSRDPFTVEQLTRIFHAPLFTGCRSKERRSEPGLVRERDGKYWIPIVALYSGMRLGEIVQLLVSDLKCDGEILCFDISRVEGDDKKLKTQSSRRLVPVHSRLFELGFGEYIKDQRSMKRVRLFHDIEKGADGYYSHNFSKWWGRYARSINVATPRTAFHSFRHNFKDALLTADVPESISRALMGHADTSVHARYGLGPKAAQLQIAVDKVRYGSGNVI